LLLLFLAEKRFAVSISLIMGAPPLLVVLPSAPVPAAFKVVVFKNRKDLV
jgi:hypothetical protein